MSIADRMNIFGDLEEERIHRFREKHVTRCGCMKFKITILPTGIGDGIDIKCCACGKKKDVTDYDSW